MVAVPATERALSCLSIRLFGPFEVRRNGELLPRLRSRKGQELLALLTLRHDREVERGWLAGILWPDSSADHAFGSLRRSLTDLRRALGPEASCLRSPTPRTLCLDPAGAEADVVAFDVAIARGDTASLHLAVALYRGPLLEGWTEEWLFQERQTREEAYLGALERLATEARARGEAPAAAGYLRRAVAVDATRETAQRALMEALAASGDYAAATLVYRDFRLFLEQELNAQPAPETRALYEQLRAEARRHARASHPAPAPAPPSSPAPPGESAGPEIVPAPPATDSRAAPRHNLPQPLTRFIGRRREIAELKRLLLPHVGRESRVEAREVSSGLIDPRPSTRDPQPSTLATRDSSPVTRLLTLTGAGGTGKTRLALHVAAELVEAYADGVWLVELATLTDPALVPHAVSTVLQMPEEPGRPLAETLVDRLRGRSLLLLLDNCEHLVAACAQLAGQLLRGCPRLRILASSREVLGIAGETAFTVPPLSLPPTGVQAFSRSGGPTTNDERPTRESRGPDVGRSSLVVGPPERLIPDSWRLLRSEAVRLFIHRATAVLPGFDVTERNALAIAEVCRRLDGIPLAIELAAPRVKVLSVEQIAQRLDDRFRLLTGGSRTAAPRHQTLRATIDWSYHLLSEPERVLLRRLALFRGGFTLEAAEAVCADELTNDERPTTNAAAHAGDPASSVGRSSFVVGRDDVLDLLTSLVDKSLVVVETHGEATRYRLLETIRAYAWEHLQSGEELPDLRARHRDWYLELAEQAEPELRGPAQAAWLDRLELEHPNLRAALEWSLSSAGCGVRNAEPEIESNKDAQDRQDEPGSLSSSCLSCASLLSPNLSPPHSALRTPHLEAALRLAAALGPFWAIRGYWTEGRARLTELLALAASAPGGGSPTVVKARARALHAAGVLADGQEEYETARAFFAESLAIHQERGDRPGMAAALRSLGLAAQRLGDDATARARCEKSLTLYRELPDPWGIAGVLGDLGFLAGLQGEPAAARAAYEESLAISRKLGDLHGIAATLNCLADLARDRGDDAAAGALYEESLALFRRIGDRWAIAVTLNDLALVSLHRGDAEAARSFCEQSLALFQELDHQEGIASCLGNLGEVARARGDFPTARARYEESLLLFQQLGSRRGIALSFYNLGQVAQEEGDGGAAAALFGQSLSLRRELADMAGVAACLEGLAGVAVGGGEPEQAARLFGAAAALRERAGASGSPLDRAASRRHADAARARLGEPAFAAAWDEGRALTLEAALAAARNIVE